MEENTKVFVIDASFMFGAILPDELTDSAQDILIKHSNGSIQLIASPIFPYEILNGLRNAVMRKRITLPQAKEIAENFLVLEIKTPDVDFSQVFALALKHNLTVYDASYLFLAKKYKTTLLSKDKKLQELA